MTVFLPLQGVRVSCVVMRGLRFCQLKVLFRFISYLKLRAGSKKKIPSYRTLRQFWFLKKADLCLVLLCRQPRCEQYCPGYGSYKWQRIPWQQYPWQVLYVSDIPVKLNSSQLYRHAGSKGWDASLVSNLRSHTLSQTELASILQIG